MKNVALAPGGMGYFALLGCLENIKDIGELSGASAGALAATLYIAAKGNVHDVLDTSMKLDLENVTRINIKTFMNSYGFVDTKHIQALLNEILEEMIGKSNITFKELWEWNPIVLYISATCIDRKTVEYFSHVTHPNMPVALAVGASVAIPFYFSPVRINGNLYIDGGCLECIPMGPFLLKNPEDNIAINLILSHTKREGILGFFSDIINMYMDRRCTYTCNTQYDVNLTYHDVLNFNMDEQMKMKLYLLGSLTTRCTVDS